MDAVYMVKAGDDNEELRYSLRTLVNLPFIRNVVFVGHKPAWVKNVRLIPRDQRLFSKYFNTTNNLLKACKDDKLSDDFLLMNDDFFIMKIQYQPPNFHRGPLDPVMQYYLNLPENYYGLGILETKKYMEKLGIINPMSYELHVPMVLNKKKFSELILKQRKENPIEVVHKRTLYGNYYNIGGTHMEDCKIVGDYKVPDTPFLSTDEQSFERYKVGEYIRNRFQLKSPFEI